MKNDATAVSMTATTPSINRMPEFIACAIGESFSPKHTGHASATFGAATRNVVTNRRLTTVSASQTTHFPLKHRAIDGEHDAAGDRQHGAERIRRIVRRLILIHAPRRHEGGEDHRNRDEEKVKCFQRHVNAPRARSASPAPECRWCP